MSAMTESLDRAVGKIQGMIELVVEEQKKGRADRDEMKSDIRALTSAVSRLNDTIAAQGTRITSVEGAAGDMKRWRERAIGAGVVIGAIAAAVGGGAATIWRTITGVFQ